MLLDTTKKSAIGKWMTGKGSKHDLHGPGLTRKMREHIACEALEQASKEVGMYREAIEQMRMEKEALTQKIAKQQQNYNLCKNKAKQAKADAGVIRLKFQNEMATLERIQTCRRDTLDKLADNTAQYKAAAKAQLDAKDYKKELQGRIQHEMQLCDTLNRICQKLNFERSEAEHFANVQKVEIK